MKVLGIVLMAVGVLVLAYGGLSYTTHKRALDMGPIQVEKAQYHNVPLPPLLGVGGILIGGIIFFAAGRAAR